MTLKNLIEKCCEECNVIIFDLCTNTENIFVSNMIPNKYKDVEVVSWKIGSRENVEYIQVNVKHFN